MRVKLVCYKMIGRIFRVDFYHLANEVDKILFGTRKKLKTWQVPKAEKLSP